MLFFQETTLYFIRTMVDSRNGLFVDIFVHPDRETIKMDKVKDLQTELYINLTNLALLSVNYCWFVCLCTGWVFVYFKKENIWLVGEYDSHLVQNFV